MTQIPIFIFDGGIGQGDDEYLGYLENNSHAFVANVPNPIMRNANDYVRLHIASCQEARKHRRGESLTGHSQSKICSPSQEVLVNHLAQKYGMHRLWYSQCNVRGGCGYFWNPDGSRS